MMSEIDDDLHIMANFRPADTGLPMVVWVSERQGQHDVRVKVSMAHGEKARPGLGVRVTAKGTRTFIAQWTDPATKRKVREPLGVWGK
jgi:hypothetical protein